MKAGGKSASPWWTGARPAVDSTGTYLSQFGSYGLGDGQFRTPGGICPDLGVTTNFLVVDSYNNRVQKFAGVAGLTFDFANASLTIAGRTPTGTSRCRPRPGGRWSRATQCR